MTSGANRTNRVRLDHLLVRRGLAPTRAKAQALILAGRVFSGELRLEKAGARLPDDLDLRVTPGRRFVGRGGHKLAGALQDFDVHVEGRDALDVGASTGGFTQVLLEAGASRVIALDVGRGQLDWSLRSDPRVVPLEGVNARYLQPSQLPFSPWLAVMDVSFISVELVLPPVAACLSPGGVILALVKPQFEVGRNRVGRGGIVRDPALHRAVLEKIVAFAEGNRWGILGIVPSRLAGAEGNREFFLFLAPDGPGADRATLERRMDRAAAPPGERTS